MGANLIGQNLDGNDLSNIDRYVQIRSAQFKVWKIFVECQPIFSLGHFELNFLFSWVVDDGNLMNFNCVVHYSRVRAWYFYIRTNSQNGRKLVYDTEIVHSFYQIAARFQNQRKIFELLVHQLSLSGRHWLKLINWKTCSSLPFQFTGQLT
jgi:hypothetical protein